MNPLPKTLLIVDDEETIHRALGRTLRKEPYELLHAHDSVAALAILEQKDHVDGILCDHYMPGVRGLDLLREIRQKYPAMATVLLTAQADLTLALAAINEGHIHRFLTKPWDADELRAVLREVMGVAPDPGRAAKDAAIHQRLHEDMTPECDENGAWIIEPSTMPQGGGEDPWPES